MAAPGSTAVAITFDGAAGPAGTVTVEGNATGYRVDYSSGGVDCANQAGAAISIVVNGQVFPTGATVGSGDPAFLFNVDAN